jgi:hypothetical protein
VLNLTIKEVEGVKNRKKEKKRKGGWEKEKNYK